MGLYDTLIYGKNAVQVKCLGSNMLWYEPGEKVPPIHYYEGYEMWPEPEQVDTYTIILPTYEPLRYVLIKNRVYVKLTNEPKETHPPYISKWGTPLSDIDGFSNPFQNIVDSLRPTMNEEKQE